MENALLTILTSNNEDDQEDNYELLKIKDCTMTPFIQLDFQDNTLNREELTRIFCSNIYILNYVKTLNDFLPESNKKVNEKEIKIYIENYFLNHNRNIYFCTLPERMMAISIHTGNIYLKARYLEEYYNEESKNPQIIIREKIILNLGHEINHILLREISDSMSQNFLIKSKCKNKKNNNNSELIFVSKFDSKRTHKFNIDESGDYFDFNFFNKFYFDTLYLKEANFFLNIKNITTLEEYNEQLKIIIEEEKVNKPLKISVNKFKIIDSEPARCFKSRILGVGDTNSINNTNNNP